MTVARYEQAAHGFGPFSEDGVPVVVPVYWNGTAWALATSANATHVVVDSTVGVLWVTAQGEYDRGAAEGYPLGVDLGTLYPHGSVAGTWQAADPGDAAVRIDVLDSLRLVVSRHADTLYQVRSEKDAADGYAGISTGGKVEHPVLSATDLEVTGVGEGLIVPSPDSTRWRITVSNAGVVEATAV